MSLIDMLKQLFTPPGRYQFDSPKNLHGRIESICEESVTYHGSDSKVTSDIIVDEGLSVIVNDKKNGWLRLWK